MNQNLARGLAVLGAVLAVAAIVMGNAWKANATRKGLELEQAGRRYSVDSAAWQERARQLEDSIAGLAHVGDSLKAGWAISREASGAGLVTIRALIAQLPKPQQDSAAPAILAIEGERAACSLVVLNCEQRVGAERSGRLGALARLRASDSLRIATTGMWRDAERRARPSFFRDIWRAKAAVLPALTVAGVCLAR